MHVTFSYPDFLPIVHHKVEPSDIPMTGVDVLQVDDKRSVHTHKTGWIKFLFDTADT